MHTRPGPERLPVAKPSMRYAPHLGVGLNQLTPRALLPRRQSSADRAFFPAQQLDGQSIKMRPGVKDTDASDAGTHDYFAARQDENVIRRRESQGAPAARFAS